MGYEHPDEDRPDDREDRDCRDREQEREERGARVARVDEPRDDPELNRDEYAHDEDPQEGQPRKPHGSLPRSGMRKRKSSGGYRRITVFTLSFSYGKVNNMKVRLSRPLSARTVTLYSK